MSKNRGKSKLSNNVLFNANKRFSLWKIIGNLILRTTFVYANKKQLQVMLLSDYYQIQNIYNKF
jgi:hypothetical protein